MPADGDARPRIDAAIRVFQTGNRSNINGRIEPGDPTLDALAACHLAGIRSGRVRAENWAFVPLRRPGDPSLSEADWRAAFAVVLAAAGRAASNGVERPDFSRRTSGGSIRLRAERAAAFPPGAADPPPRWAEHKRTITDE